MRTAQSSPRSPVAHARPDHSSPRAGASACVGTALCTTRRPETTVRAASGPARAGHAYHGPRPVAHLAAVSCAPRYDCLLIPFPHYQLLVAPVITALTHTHTLSLFHSGTAIACNGRSQQSLATVGIPSRFRSAAYRAALRVADDRADRQPCDKPRVGRRHLIDRRAPPAWPAPYLPRDTTSRGIPHCPTRPRAAFARPRRIAASQFRMT